MTKIVDKKSRAKRTHFVVILVETYFKLTAG